MRSIRAIECSATISTAAGGRVSAISAIRHGDPALAAIRSPYEAFTRERPKEDYFEQVRAREFPACPSRFGCIFLFTTRESGDACNAEWWKGARVILEGTIVSAINVGTFDSRQLDALPQQWETAARHYWSGEMTLDSPRPEVLLNGTIQLVGWEQHAELLRL